ncbi:hypothetical protein [Luedemannella flava]|uniref:hypothetical protein n=1 Tax=Luedemannella flava TaxID=349316 RepID=UPI0031E055A4
MIGMPPGVLIGRRRDADANGPFDKVYVPARVEGAQQRLALCGGDELAVGGDELEVTPFCEQRARTSSRIDGACLDADDTNNLSTGQLTGHGKLAGNSPVVAGTPRATHCVFDWHARHVPGSTDGAPVHAQRWAVRPTDAMHNGAERVGLGLECDLAARHAGRSS